MNLKAVIIDDEEGAREGLVNILNQYIEGVEVIGKAASAKEGFELIKSAKPDVVFLDVEMPLENGFQMLERFQKIDFDVIFVTAYQHFALKAIKFSALDYLLKPIDIDELESAVQKLKSKYEKEEMRNQKFANLQENLKSTDKPKTLALHDSNSVVFVPLDEIIRCESDANYTRFILKNSKRIVVAKTLGDFEEQLRDDGFYRIHRSHLINIAHMIRYDKKDGGLIEMSDNSKVEIARRKKKAFLIDAGIKNSD